ncbi:MAG: pyridoxamine 5'-phosphate oxidase family protein [Bacteroidaceae bacterium]
MKTFPIYETERIRSLIEKSPICFAAVVDSEGAPYAFPMNFGYDGQYFYLHSGPEHSALERLRADSRICLTLSVRNELMYQDEGVGCSYRMKAESLIVRGTVDFPEALDEKRRCLDVLMKHYTSAAVSYGDPAVRNVVVWRVTPLSLSAREYGVPRYGV